MDLEYCRKLFYQRALKEVSIFSRKHSKTAILFTPTEDLLPSQNG